ncbi:MAG: TAT-variant-translocated molybdopterin oxidoreductase [Anaerolineaceae bacterium]|nr:TAT-variant-translocated molybdopterin oxidoreductase [Anaerolineaceae bacterium]
MTTDNKSQEQLDLAALRKRLASQHGKNYWRSLNELAETEEFSEIVKREFPRQAQFLEEFSRRDFLKVLGASLALAGLAACSPREIGKILPYSTAPEDLIPGKPLYFASAMPKDGYGLGVLVRSEMGRPIKVDGNPRHPVSQGTSDMFMQASILDLYDPDRAKNITAQGTVKTWDDFSAALAAQSGPNLRILTGTVSSPSLADEIQAVLAKFPQAKWHQYSPLSLTRGALTQVFDQPVSVQYHFDKASVILSLDSDFLFREPGSLRYSQDFGIRRNPSESNGSMNRLYVVESSLTLTGSNADHRLAVRSADVETFARALAVRMGIQTGAPADKMPGLDWIEPLADDLLSAKGSSLVIAGERQPAIVHAIAHAINQALGAVGNTVVYTDPVESNPIDQLASLRDLSQDLDQGIVDTLLILEGNPAYTAPADLDFPGLIQKAKMSVYLGLHADETAALTTWHIPAAHYLEMWGDLRSYEGTTSIVQPLIEPLYGGKSSLEVLAILLGQKDAKGYDLVQKYWQNRLKESNFEVVWKQTLRDGFIFDIGLFPQPIAPQVNSSVLASVQQSLASDVLEITFEPDPTIWDGQYTNNAWLQELPKPLTKLTWDNAALVSPKIAQSLALNDGDIIQIKLGERSLEAPIYVQPGQAENSLAISLGYGRKQGGKVLEGTGFNAYSIRTSSAPWFAGDVQISKTGKTYQLATTRDHQSMEGRDLIRETSLAEYLQNPNFAQDSPDEQHSLYAPVNYPGHAWGMSINLGSCIGCNACVLACQAENNIPTVGKDQVSRSREMHWLRIDRYFQGSLDAPSVAFEPVPCMHCEQAPCEPVCPVGATAHNAEGINEMTYNRCVGTRYCSNNCPYKVRRFNFLKYEDDTTPSLKAMRNPDVSVRMRGVMEKCTYCIQRINAARIQAEVSGNPIKDGDVRTACQQACPTQAIVFGDLNDTSSQVRKLKDSPLTYALLGELGTKPRTTYLARVTNPNLKIKDQA